MADHLGSLHFQALFESALRAYQEKTSISLAEHPIAVQLQSCHSVESIFTLLQPEIKAFSNFRESETITKSIKTIVSKLTTLSASASLGDVFGLVRQNAPMVFHISNSLYRKSLLQMHYLLPLLSSLMYVPLSGSYVDILVTSKSTRRLKASYLAGTQSSSCSSRSNISSIVSIYIRASLVRPQWTRWSARLWWSFSPRSLSRRESSSRDDQVSLFSLTRYITQCNAVKFVKRVFRQKDIEAVLQRLDRLTQEEARTTAAQSLEVIYGLIQNMSMVMDSEQNVGLKSTTC